MTQHPAPTLEAGVVGSSSGACGAGTASMFRDLVPEVRNWMGKVNLLTSLLWLMVNTGLLTPALSQAGETDFRLGQGHLCFKGGQGQVFPNSLRGNSQVRELIET